MRPQNRLQRRYKIIMIVGIIVAIVCQVLKILLSTPSWAYGTLDTLTPWCALFHPFSLHLCHKVGAGGAEGRPPERARENKRGHTEGAGEDKGRLAQAPW
jgi:hypothetical protein